MNPKIVNYKNQRVLTTDQLAEIYGTDVNNIKNNFANNKSNFVKGKHYIYLSGIELKAFKNCVNDIDLVGKRAPSLYLWTRRGASRHCKLLGTDKAWEQFDSLEETYFNQLQQIDESQLSPELRMANQLFKSLAKQELVTKQLKSEVQGIRTIVSLKPDNWRQDTQKIISKIALKRDEFDAFRNVRTEIYKEVEQRGGFKLDIRLMNKRKRLAYEGVSKSAQDKLSKVDVITDDKRLIEVYLAVVKDFAIHYGVEVS